MITQRTAVLHSTERADFRREIDQKIGECRAILKQMYEDGPESQDRAEWEAMLAGQERWLNKLESMAWSQCQSVVIEQVY